MDRQILGGGRRAPPTAEAAPPLRVRAARTRGAFRRGLRRTPSRSPPLAMNSRNRPRRSKAAHTASATVTPSYLKAFDAAGVRGCSGVPKVCTALFQAFVGYDPKPPSVANGVLYELSEAGVMYAFDAAGRVGCTSAPTECSPLWQTTWLQDLAVAKPKPQEPPRNWSARSTRECRPSARPSSSSRQRRRMPRAAFRGLGGEALPRTSRQPPETVTSGRCHFPVACGYLCAT